MNNVAVTATLAAKLKKKKKYHMLFKESGCTFKGGNLIKMFCLPPEKESTLKGKNLHTKGSNFFCLE